MDTERLRYPGLFFPYIIKNKVFFEETTEFSPHFYLIFTLTGTRQTGLCRMFDVIRLLFFHSMDTCRSLLDIFYWLLYYFYSISGQLPTISGQLSTTSGQLRTITGQLRTITGQLSMIIK
jgi:hypothetical protein